MSTVQALDKQITGYLEQLNTKQKKAVLFVVKTFVEEQQSTPWSNKSFTSVIDKRNKELENGDGVGESWEEVKKRAKSAMSKNKLRK